MNLSRVDVRFIKIFGTILGVVSGPFLLDHLASDISLLEGTVITLFVAIILLCAYLVYRFLSHRIRLIRPSPQHPYVLVEQASMLLKKSRDSVLYYGGVGLLNLPDDAPRQSREDQDRANMWVQEWEDKLKSQEFEVRRIMDFKNAIDFVKIYESHPYFRDLAQQYLNWVTTHYKHFRPNRDFASARNTFVNFEGAPMWRQGVHIIIFDQTHLLFVFQEDKEGKPLGEQPVGVLIRDKPKIAKLLYKTLDGLRGSLVSEIEDKQLFTLQEDLELLGKLLDQRASRAEIRQKLAEAEQRRLETDAESAAGDRRDAPTAEDD